MRAQATIWCSVAEEEPLSDKIDEEGEYRALFILAEFPDQQLLSADCPGPDPWPPNQAAIPVWAQNLLEDTSTPTIDSSLTSYFYLMSGGAHVLKGVEFPRVIRLERTIASYWVSGAIDQANKDVIDSVFVDPHPNFNFSNFDVYPAPNGDGFVDHIFIYYRATTNGAGTNLSPAAAGTAALGSGVVTRDGVTIDLGNGSRLNPAQAERSFWSIAQVAAHEYGHHLLNTIPVVGGMHVRAIGKYGIMQGNDGDDEHGVTLMETFIRHKLGWIEPAYDLEVGPDLVDGVPLTVELTDVGHTGGAGFAIVRTQDEDQYFILELRDSTGTRFTQAGDCEQSVSSSGLVITHVAEKPRGGPPLAGQYEPGWTVSDDVGIQSERPCTSPECIADPGETPCPNGKYPPFADVEVATGMFNRSTWAPAPIDGWDVLSNDENDPGHSSGADLFRPGSDHVSIMSPFTNPNTNLYWFPQAGENYHAQANCELRKKQSIRSGLTFYNMEWITQPGNGGAGKMKLKVLYQNPAGGGAQPLPNGMRWDGTVQLCGDVQVPNGARLDVAPGARVIAAADQDLLGSDGESELLVNGGCAMQGVPPDFIEFTSSRSIAFTHFLGVGQNGQAGTTTDWRGLRMNLDGCLHPSYGFLASIEPLSSIEYVDLSYARNGISIENFCAPNLKGVGFKEIDGNRDIYLNGSDAFIPYAAWSSNPCTGAGRWSALRGAWDLEASTDVVASSTVTNDASWIGTAGKLDFIADSPISAVGDALNPVVFRPETPDVANGDGWGGATLNGGSEGSVLKYLDIGYASYPLVAFYPNATTIRHTTIHHFGDTGLWIYDTGALGAVVDSCVIERGAGLDISRGRRGARLDRATELRFVWNEIDLDDLDLGPGGSSAAIDVFFGKPLCLSSPPTTDSLVIRNVEILGPGHSLQAQHRGIASVWLCGSTQRKILFEGNYVHEFSSAGLEFTQCSDIQVNCNTIFDTARAVDLYRDSEPTGPGVKFKRNWLKVNVGPAEMVRTDSNQKTRLGRRNGGVDLLVAENGLAIADNAVVDWIEENDATANVVPAENNFWYLDRNGWEQQSGWDPVTFEPWSSKISGWVSTANPVDYDPVQMLNLNPPFCHAVSPPGPAAARGARPRVAAEFAPPEASRIVEPEANLRLPVENDFRILGAIRQSPSLTLELAVAPGREGRYSLHVYNLAGQRVATPYSGTTLAGIHRVNWDGRGLSGRLVTSGVYFVLAEGPAWKQTRKLVVVR